MITLESWFLFLLANSVLLAGANAVACALSRPGDILSERLVLTGLAWLALATVLVLGVGLAGMLRPYPLCAAALLAGGGLGFGLRRWSRPLWPETRQGLAAFAGCGDAVLAVAVLVFLFQALSTLVRIWYLPPLVWDSYSYHLPPVAQWLQLGGIPLELPGSVARINFQTLGMSLLNAWFTVFLGNPVLVELPQFLWWLILIPTGQALLVRAGVAPARALLFALAGAFVPACLLQSGTTQDHLALGVSFLAGVGFLDAFAKEGNPRRLLAAGMALGLCLGYKLSAPLHVLVAAGSVLALRPRRLLAAWRRAPRSAAWSGVAAFGVALVLGGWWYIKNLALYGRLQGGVLALAGKRGENDMAAGASILAANLGDFLARISDTGNLLDADLAAVSGFGPQFASLGIAALALAVPAALAGRRRGRDGLAVPLVAAMGLTLAYFSFYYSNNQYRLFLFLPVAAVWALPASLEALDFSLASAPGRVARGVALACIVWSAVAVLPVGLSMPHLVRACVAGPPESRVAANVSRYMYRLAAQRFLANAVPGNPAVAYAGHRDSWTWQYYGAGLAGRAVAVPRRLLRLEGSGPDPHLAPSPEMKSLLRRERAAFYVSTPTDNRAPAPVADPEFLEIVPGLYYYKGAVR